VTLQSPVGFFGKLPCNGDFLQRRVPQLFLDAWDPWLQECVHESRKALQEKWLPTYLTSPLWRFVLPDSVCGSGAYAGLLAPSVDRVGRYFPLTIVGQIDITTNPLEFATQQLAWFDGLESLVIKAMEEPSLDLEWFDAQVVELGYQLDEQGSAIAENFTDLFERSKFPKESTSWRVPLGGIGALQSAINVFAYRELSAQLRPASVWWTEGSEALSACWLSVRGLPAPERFAAMLSGSWAEQGWRDLGDISGAELIPSESPAPADHLLQDLHEPPQPAAPRVTVPDVQLSAIETNRAAFISRPEIGLWAVVGSEQGIDPSAVRLIADALQQLPPASSLTALVESVRGTLSEVHRGLLHMATRDVLRVESHANVVVFLLRGAECAFMSAGQVQTLRVRARKIEWLDKADHTEYDSPGDSGSLMELISGESNSAQGLGVTGFQDLRVRYERLLREDHLILCARVTIGSTEGSQLAATAASGLPISAASIIQMLTSQTRPEDVVPILTLEV
jgi:type VI secretion system protein ImpM